MDDLSSILRGKKPYKASDYISPNSRDIMTVDNSDLSHGMLNQVTGENLNEQETLRRTNTIRDALFGGQITPNQGAQTAINPLKQALSDIRSNMSNMSIEPEVKPVRPEATSDLIPEEKKLDYKTIEPVRYDGAVKKDGKVPDALKDYGATLTEKTDDHTGKMQKAEAVQSYISQLDPVQVGDVLEAIFTGWLRGQGINTGKTTREKSVDYAREQDRVQQMQTLQDAQNEKAYERENKQYETRAGLENQRYNERTSKEVERQAAIEQNRRAYEDDQLAKRFGYSQKEAEQAYRYNEALQAARIKAEQTAKTPPTPYSAGLNYNTTGGK